MNAQRSAIALVLIALAAASAEAAITQKAYKINPGGTYQYKFPLRDPGIPGGSPSEHEFDFGISGTFDYQLDTAGPTAHLLNLNFVLTGNEAIQAAAPDGHPVTADSVEAYLASHTFVNDFIGALLHLKSATTPDLKLTDSLSGNVSIAGGFDHRPFDGTAMQFQFSAVTVPEPTGALPAATALLAFARRRR